MKRYDNINNGGVCRPLNYAHRTQQQAFRCHRSHFCHGILDWKDVCWSRDYMESRHGQKCVAKHSVYTLCFVAHIRYISRWVTPVLSVSGVTCCKK
ncbi:unnamed protein product [Rhizophagus irregularis]|uniref:Uncharacterized protein n=1 Tax=Rhizophagus irregularis TaxID=588596 RepID=A0A915YXH0_9GLOM|nr:unnamed protein product [Rhizophagus irregularis]